MSIATKLAELTQIRTDIRTSLIGKGISASTHDFADFPTDIDNISGGTTYESVIQNKTIIKLPTESYVSTVDSNNSHGFGKLLADTSTNFVFNPASASSRIRIIYKFRLNSNFSSDGVIYGGNESTYLSTAGTAGCGISGGNISAFSNIRLGSSRIGAALTYNLQVSTWYYICSVGTVGGSFKVYLYDENGNKLDEGTGTGTYTPASNTTVYSQYGGRTGFNTVFGGDIDLSECFYEIDGTEVWGKKNAKTATMGV